MASLELCAFRPWNPPVLGGEGAQWTPSSRRKAVDALPQIFWEGGRSWDEANLWALDSATGPAANELTTLSRMRHLHAYAKYLESGERARLDWRHFPVARDERVLTKFRGHLLRMVDAGDLALSTASARMAAVVLFYRFAANHNLVRPEGQMWSERTVVVRLVDSSGFKRSIARASTDLHIRNTSLVGGALEDGLLPLSVRHTVALLEYLGAHETEELELMLRLGFYTGARVGTITTLRCEDLDRARPDPHVEGLHLIRVGPGTTVKTKFSRKGDLLVPTELLQNLRRYSESVGRLKREARAKTADKTILFLTRKCRPYSVATVDRLVKSMRESATAAGLEFMSVFRFHQSRATFGTQLTWLLLNVVGASAALDFVRRAMLHKSEATTLKYIRFIEGAKAKNELADTFSKLFSGVDRHHWM